MNVAQEKENIEKLVNINADLSYQLEQAKATKDITTKEFEDKLLAIQQEKNDALTALSTLQAHQQTLENQVTTLTPEEPIHKAAVTDEAPATSPAVSSPIATPAPTYTVPKSSSRDWLSERGLNMAGIAALMLIACAILFSYIDNKVDNKAMVSKISTPNVVTEVTPQKVATADIETIKIETPKQKILYVVNPIDGATKTPKLREQPNTQSKSKEVGIGTPLIYLQKSDTEETINHRTDYWYKVQYKDKEWWIFGFYVREEE
jgi:hypothetical protein